MNSQARPVAVERGFSLIELLIALALSSVLLLALNGVTGQVLTTYDAVTTRNALSRDLHFAMAQIARATESSNYLLVPYSDHVATTGVAENIHTVLAVTLDHMTDLDGNGVPDADNDGDGRFDEDPPADWTNDGAAGIVGIDDDLDGAVDEGSAEADDESATANTDHVNGIDDDGDNNIDEDPAADLNGDGCPGICGVDDDADGSVDEGGSSNDDEDGATDEDWLDPVVFYLRGTELVKRQPVPWDEDGNGVRNGRDYVESVIAENITRFRVERLAAVTGAPEMIEVNLQLTDPVSGESVSLQSRMRVGGLL